MLKSFGKTSLRRSVAVAVIIAASHAYAQGGSASGIRPVHEDADGKLWIDPQTELSKQYVDPNNAHWVDHDHVQIYGCSYCSKIRP